MNSANPPEAAASLDTRLSLLVGLQKGQGEESWREFYTKYREYILSMATRLGLDADQASDVLQTVMMVVIREACGFHYEPATRSFRNAAVIRDGAAHTFTRFRSWLKGVVQIKVWEVRKFAARGGSLFPDGTGAVADHIPDPGPQPDEVAEEISETAFRRAILDQALVTLRESYRGSDRNMELFEEIALHGIPGPEAASKYGVTEVHARQIVYSLRQRLKQIIGDLLQESERP